MSRIRRILAGAGFALALLAGPGSAQTPNEIQVLPANLSLPVNSADQVFATVFDERGTPILGGVRITWASNNVGVAVVTWDDSAPEFATVTAVSPGTAQIEARIGNLRSSIVVVEVVVGVPEVEPIEIPALPDSVLPVEVSTVSVGTVARIEPHNFGFQQPCRVGGFVGANLLLTSYRAIRGADSINVTLPSGGRVNSGVRVAAYDPAIDLVVLHVPVQRTGEMSVGQDPARDDFVWVIGQPDCQATVLTPARIASAPLAGGQMALDQTTVLGQLGAPVINQAGEIVGVAVGGTAAARAADIATLVSQARRNLGAGSLVTALEVATAEQHTYGSVAFRSNLLDGVARITPLETWHWPELARQSQLPITFAGPEGRYQVEFLSSGAVQSTTTVTIQPGVATQLLLVPTAIAPAGPEEPPPPPPGAEIEPAAGGGGSVLPFVLLGLAGAGAAAFLLGGGGGDDGGGDGGNGTGNGLTTGRIIFFFPNP